MSRYFIIEKNNPNHDSIMDCIVKPSDVKLESLDGSMFWVKLPLKDLDNHDCLDGIKEFTHIEMKLERKKPEWQKDEII